MVVEVVSEEMTWTKLEYDISAKLLRKVMQHWTARTGLPLPCAQLVEIPPYSWKTPQSYIQVRTPDNIIPSLALRTIHRNDQAPLYRQYGLEFDILEFQGYDDGSWTTLLELIGSLEGMPVLKELTFDHCYKEISVKDLKDWIVQRTSKGFVVPKVCFRECRKEEILTTYLALKRSGLVSEVTWE
jgi:hypothetical protein